MAYLDCFAGVSGDMFLGALVDAGVEIAVLQDATKALALGAKLRVSSVDRSGITATKVDVMQGDQLAEDPGADRRDEQQRHEHQQQPKTQHLHKGGHEHHQEEHREAATADQTSAPHAHEHGRSLSVIRELIRTAPLPDAVKEMALRTFELLGTSEAKIHNVPIETIHFHEVGAVDAIVDIVASAAGVHALQEAALQETNAPIAWHCSPLNVGSGMVQCAHGNFPVPAPATADLLRGLPTYSAHVQRELTTPTGAAIIRMLAPVFGAQPAMQVVRIGYGAGGRNPPGFPNTLRLMLGEANSNGELATSHVPASDQRTTHDSRETVVVLETAVDDSSPQLLAHVMEQALANGALDAMTAAVGMKKGRPGTLLTILSREEDVAKLESLLLRETTTLGVRRRREERSCMEREHIGVSTEFGEIRLKLGRVNGEVLNAQPEFEDCRAAAVKHSIPVKRVLEAAIAGYALLKSSAS